jgi:cytochrome c oxidase assembly protein subunit 11
VVIALAGLVAGMTGLSFAAVPLYDLFCRVTGFGGTTQVAAAPANRVLDRRITIRFNADVNGDVPWQFRPERPAIEMKVGETALVSYSARNLSDKPVTGTAVYNVTPQKAGLYFNKIQCFCFDEQVLQAGQRVDMPVYFFVDPAIADDPNLDDVNTITLSYTFFRAKSDGTAQVSENYQAPAAAH